MLKELTANLYELGIRYCILHGWQSLPDHLPSDLDIVVNPEDLRSLEEILLCYKDGEVCQLLQHESSGFYFVLSVREENKIRFIPVDAATDYRDNGRVFFSADELLANRGQCNGLWVASPDVELAYLMIK